MEAAIHVDRLAGGVIQQPVGDGSVRARHVVRRGWPKLAGGAHESYVTVPPGVFSPCAQAPRRIAARSRRTRCGRGAAPRCAWRAPGTRRVVSVAATAGVRMGMRAARRAPTSTSVGEPPLRRDADEQQHACGAGGRRPMASDIRARDPGTSAGTHFAGIATRTKMPGAGLCWLVSWNGLSREEPS
jgi:hypothetical protein